MQVISSLKKCQYTRERYQNLTEEEKNKKREYGHKHYKNLSEDEKQKLVEYRKKVLQKAKKYLKGRSISFSFSYKSKNGLVLG